MNVQNIPATYTRSKESMELSMRWAERCKKLLLKERVMDCLE